jgi:hypothetical protein
VTVWHHCMYPSVSSHTTFLWGPARGAPEALGRSFVILGGECAVDQGFCLLASLGSVYVMVSGTATPRSWKARC